MKDIMAEDFQLVVKDTLKRNINILDTASKLNSSSSRLCRAAIKSSTQCGCTALSAVKTEKDDTGVTGCLCSSCREAVEKEMGDVLYYMAGLANALDISLYDVMLKEKRSALLLGKYNLM